MKRLVALFAFLFAPAVRADPDAPVPEAQEAVEFIRVTEDERATRLETAITRFEKDGVAVDLIGAIHIADADYYHTLNERFEAYDALLFEGIGGRDPGPPEAAVPAPDEPPGQDQAPEDQAPEDEPAAAREPQRLDGLHTVYNRSAAWLELSYQMNEIDYTKANFVHADVSMDEFTELQAGRKESLFGFMLKVGLSSEAPEVKQPTTIGLIRALIKKDKNALKLQLVHTLGAGDDQIARIAGESVIITDRNAKCLKVLDEQIAAGRKKLGIFYGAAHFPDMEDHLLADGWTETGREWLTAWDIDK